MKKISLQDFYQGGKNINIKCNKNPDIFYVDVNTRLIIETFLF